MPAASKAVWTRCMVRSVRRSPRSKRTRVFVDTFASDASSMTVRSNAALAILYCSRVILIQNPEDALDRR